MHQHPRPEPGNLHKCCERHERRRRCIRPIAAAASCSFSSRRF
ncbi:unnamed protein product [Linum tenue]|uniref:Uncharacterized protein n=1 Tax=Linum tenue TaxID=586396 RepID=A0AAV0LIF8_9ROSI|nr:unnamed protein product [Linum tenue]